VEIVVRPIDDLREISAMDEPDQARLHRTAEVVLERKPGACVRQRDLGRAFGRDAECLPDEQDTGDDSDFGPQAEALLQKAAEVQSQRSYRTKPLDPASAATIPSMMTENPGSQSPRTPTTLSPKTLARALNWWSAGKDSSSQRLTASCRSHPLTTPRGMSCTTRRARPALSTTSVAGE
jgi:hypothetical protein